MDYLSPSTIAKNVTNLIRKHSSPTNLFVHRDATLCLVLMKYKLRQIHNSSQRRPDTLNQSQKDILSLWRSLSEEPDNGRSYANELAEKLEQLHPELKRTLSTINFRSLSIDFFSHLVIAISSINLDYALDIDLILYEEITSQFPNPHDSTAHCNITKEIAQPFIQLLRARDNYTIYDPSCGNGRLLTIAQLTIDAQNCTPEYYGEESSDHLIFHAKIRCALSNQNTIRFSEPPPFEAIPSTDKASSTRHDLAISYPPIGRINPSIRYFYNLNKSSFPHGLPSSNCFLYIQTMLKNLKENGRGFIIAPQSSLFGNNRDRDVRLSLLSKDILEAVISIPQGFPLKHRFNLSIIFFNKEKSPIKKNKVLFIDAEELTKEDYPSSISLNKNLTESLDEIFFDHKVSPEYSRVVIIDEIIKNNGSLYVRDYIDASEISKRIHNHNEKLKYAKLEKIKNLALQIKCLRGENCAKKVDNSIFVPRTPNTPSTTSNNVASHSQTYYQTSLDRNLILSDYAIIFLNSEIGKLTIKKAAKGSLNHINKEDFENMEIPVPTIERQRKLIFAHNEMNGLTEIAEKGKSLISLEAGMSKIDDIIKDTRNAFNTAIHPSNLDTTENGKLSIYTEGKTDRLHMASALEHFQNLGQYVDLKLDLKTNNHGDGDENLSKLCMSLASISNASLSIFLFDRDNLRLSKKMSGENIDYKNHGNSVYSVVLPKTSLRSYHNICIEHYYHDSDLAKMDSEGRRIFLKEEFEEIGIHKTLEHTVHLHPKNKTRIVDSGVINTDTRKPVALSKSLFANYIHNRTPPFNDMNFSEFSKLFDLIVKIRNLHNSK